MSLSPGPRPVEWNPPREANPMNAPELSGDALGAVRHRGSHLQIIASAGAGKTEVVSQRVADLLVEGVPPRAIVAFTFTERAAEELKYRIALRVEERMGKQALDALVGLFVGTIHSFCFQLLQRYVPRYETYDVVNENQLTALLSREAHRLGVRDLDPRRDMFAAIDTFARSVDVVENELLEPTDVPGRFGEVLDDYLAMLERYRLITYGQQIVQAVKALEDRDVADAVHADLQHLIVDEYQDVNPAQERLIELLVAGGAELCVVGDDDQAIYQWRGSDVSNIVRFKDRYQGVAEYSITRNRRSRPEIIDAANNFARSIPNRLPKKMQPDRPASRTGESVVCWSASTAVEEAGWIANMILDLHKDHRVAYRDIAVLVRGRTSYPALIEAFRALEIPVRPGGRTGLFDEPEAVLLGKTFCWLADIEWRSGYDGPEVLTEDDLLVGYESLFGVAGPRWDELRSLLRAWRLHAKQEREASDLVGELYQLCDVLHIDEWDPEDSLAVSRLGTLARFTMLLTDYESVRRRARPDAGIEGEQVGGQDRGPWHYKNLAIHIINYAQGAYEGFDGEPDFDLDAVDLTTVHRAKGLEWPVVFVPSMTANRFPSSKTGTVQDWQLPRTMFNAARYEGSDADERRLFYVAMTRARDFVSISRHDRVTKQRTDASPYFGEVAGSYCNPDGVVFPEVEPRHADEEQPLVITFSELSQYLGCGMEYRLRSLLGFQPRLAPELGYGKAVHHMLRAVADHTREHGMVPSSREIDRMLDDRFFLPTANKVAHREMKEAARRLVGQYVTDYRNDFFRVWESERPFELRLDGVTISGRADVILDHENGAPTGLAILDYKTSTKSDGDHDLQLQVYANAGRREGLDVRGAFVHDLKRANRATVDVGAAALQSSESRIVAAAARIRDRDFRARPSASCRSCEVRTVCGSAQK